MSIYGNKIILGSIGDKTVLNELLSEMTDLVDNKEWGKEVELRLADGVLLQYLIFNGPYRAASASIGRIASSEVDALYWSGWLNFIQGDFDKAKADFNMYMLKLSGDRSYRAKIINADAKFRSAECIFWQGVKLGNIAMLNDAKDSYRALGNPDGQFYQFLSPELQSMIQTRLFLINIEGSLAGSADVSLFDAAMNFAGLKLPDNADDYLNVGRYFLEKGIKTAEQERKNALAFAQKSFDLVVRNGAVSSDLKNKGNFMKGVGLVKLATTQEGADLQKTIKEAQDVLAQCRAPYDTEAAYVTGISFFNVNDFVNAKSKFNSLASKGHIRATYYEALSSEKDCKVMGGLLKKILQTVKDRTNYWYQNADLEFAKLPCKGEIPPQSPYSSLMADPPMSYENLVDQEADIADKKLQALQMWQRISSGKRFVDVDQLIEDKPPETNVTVRLLITPKGGEEKIIVDGDESIAVSDGESAYKVTVTRGNHSIKVIKKGYYIYESSKKISKTETITLELNKAVRYTQSGFLTDTNMPMAIASGREDIFVANNNTSEVVHIGSDGSVKNKVTFSTLGIETAIAIAVDGDVFVVSDSRFNKIVMSNFDGTDVNVIAYGNETYAGSLINNPSGIAADQGTYYVVDSGNKRVLVFEGSSFRRAFGDESLVKPVGITVNPDNKDVYVADMVKGAIVRFNSGGEAKESFKLDNQSTPSSIYRDGDGYYYVADFVNNNVAKYDSEMGFLTIASDALENPRGVSMLGSGPEAAMYVATKGQVTVLKGGWDNVYIPE